MSFLRFTEVAVLHAYPLTWIAFVVGFLFTIAMLPEASASVAMPVPDTNVHCELRSVRPSEASSIPVKSPLSSCGLSGVDAQPVITRMGMRFLQSDPSLFTCSPWASRGPLRPILFDVDGRSRRVYR